MRPVMCDVGCKKGVSVQVSGFSNRTNKTHETNETLMLLLKLKDNRL